LKNDSRIERIGDGDLYIHNVTHSQDDGTYKCSVSNDQGESFQEENIRIYGKLGKAFQNMA
jgi:hypothetical protein